MKKTSLSDKECNVLSQVISPITIKQQEIDESTKIIVTQEEDLYFEKGFLKEDVKEFIKRFKEELLDVKSFYSFKGNIRYEDWIIGMIERLAGDNLK